MGEKTSSQDTDSDNLETIAASIFSHYGIDMATVQRAGGWTNAVWLADELVLRLSTNKEKKSLLSEARLSTYLPSEVGYPRILETGTTAGYAWTLAQRLPGKSLGERWANLHWQERVTALQGLWARAQAVHTVPYSDVASLIPSRAWFNSTNPEEAEISLTRLTKEQIFTNKEASALQGILAHFWNVLPAAPCVLCHGDLTLANALWHEGQVIALLDFEFAVLAPVQLDLNHLLKCAFGPDDALIKLPEVQRLRQAAQELARPILAEPDSRVLLLGYALLLELWLLELWLAHPEGEGPLEQWEPLRRLRSLADGRGGYLAPLLQH